MWQIIAKTRHHSHMVLRCGPTWNKPGANKVIWEHGRKNFELRRDDLLPIVCTVADGSDLSGISTSTERSTKSKR